MNDPALLAAVMKVGKPIVAATRNGDRAVIAAATSIAEFVQQHDVVGGDLLLGADDALPAMHKALGSALTARRDMRVARLAAFALARSAGAVAVGEQCPCGNAIEDGETASLALVVNRAA